MDRNLERAQDRYKHYADKDRYDAPNFNPGDKVWLLRSNIKTQRPCAKLDYSKVGPFTIKEKISASAFRLELPPTWKIHDVFHVSLLERHFKNEYPGRHQEERSVPPVLIDGVPEYEVDYVVATRRRRNRQEYLVHWKGYGVQERTWEPLANLRNSREALRKFHQALQSRELRREIV